MTSRRPHRLLLLLCLTLMPLLALGKDGDKDSGAAIPGVDVSAMTPSEVTTLRELLEKYPSACGKSHSLLVSLKKDPACKRSLYTAKWLARKIREGYLRSEVEEAYKGRYLDRKCYNIDIVGAPVRGDPKAPVTIVEFSDFECPHCRMAEPVLKGLLQEMPNVRLVFLNYPLPAHQNAPNAAAAAIAAGKQGKFWAYHDKLFDNQSSLSMIDLLRYAQELKLDVNRFQADLEGARPRVAKERAQGEKAEITGTPTFFISCHQYKDALTIESMKAWIEEELSR